MPVSVSRRCAVPVGVWAVRRAGRGGWAVVFRRFVGCVRRFVGFLGRKRPAAPVRPAAQNRPASRPSRRKTAWPRCPSPLVKPPAAPALPALAGGCWLHLASATKMIRFAAESSANIVYTFRGCGWWVGVSAGSHVCLLWLAPAHPAACCRQSAVEVAWVLDVTFCCCPPIVSRLSLVVQAVSGSSVSLRVASRPGGPKKR